MQLLQLFPDLEKKAGCSQCGLCCETIRVGDDIHRDNVRDVEFFREYWKPMSKEEAGRINPWLIKDPRDVVSMDWYPDEEFYYSCSAYDKESKLCTVHEIRPQVCRGFPWYGKSINNAALSGHMSCSYWADVPIEAWPQGVSYDSSLAE